MNASLLLYALMILIVLHSNGRQRGLASYLRKLGFAGTGPLHEALAAAKILAVMLIATVIMGMAFSASGMEEDMMKVPETLTGFDFAEVLAVMTVASVVEEIFFRGYLQRKTNLLVASFIFAFFHIIYGSLTEVIGAFVLGSILGYGYMRRRNLFAPILAHYAYNIITVIAIFSVAAS